jgi:DNA-binding NarL/FixJ family response regulator
MTRGDSIRVLLADDHPIVRDGLRLVLERRADITVVAEADDGRVAVRLAQEHHPLVAIVDLDMPALDGVGVIKELARTLPVCRCLVLTLHEDDAYLFDALSAGAAGYLVKGAPSEDIERAVRSAAAGQVILGAEVARRITSAAGKGRPRPGGERFEMLSDRELELLELLAEGLDNAAIAQRLHLAPKTVRNQISGLLASLDAPDRITAIQAARDAGLGVTRQRSPTDP